MTFARISNLRPLVRVPVFTKHFASGQSTSSSSGIATEFLNESELKRQLLDAALKHVLSNGWTAETVALGANELKLPDVTTGLFLDPGASLVFHYIRKKNGELVEYMSEESLRLNRQPKISFSNFVINAMKYRLQLNIPYIKRLSEALAIATRPDHLPESSNLLLKMCEDICFYGGDHSTDYTWYTKRTSIAGIYGVTELYMLQDKSMDFEDTWRFMYHRFDDVKNVGQLTKQATSLASTVLDLAYSFYVVGRNTMGVNTKSQSWRRN